MLRTLALTSAIACVALPAGFASAAVTVTEGVRYGSARVAAPQPASAPLLLDLYRPARRARTPRAVVVLIHGGGFRQGSRNQPQLVQVARALAGRGIVVASIDYRLLPQQPIPSRRVASLLRALPEAPISTAIVAAVDDTLTAVAYLRRRAARLGIDTRRLGLVGGSAGAITANHVGYVLDDHGIRGPRVRFVASLWGGVIVPRPGGRRGAPALQVDRGEPAMFAVHGTADPTVPVALTDQLVARARAVRLRTEYHRMTDAGHGFVASRFFTEAVAGDDTPFDRLLDFASARLR